jgi:phosphate acetyltransferase
MEAFSGQNKSRNTISSRRIIFTEGQDVRIIKAARILADQKTGIPVILGNPSQIRQLAEANKVSTRLMRIMHPRQNPAMGSLMEIYRSLTGRGKITRDEAEKHLSHPLRHGIMEAVFSKTGLCVSGLEYGAGAIIDTLIEINRLKNNEHLLSGLAVIRDQDRQRLLLFVDCAMIPRPGSDQIAEITVTSARNFRKITGEEPRAALLSFSTAGSAEHEMTGRIREAANLARAMAPGLIVEGEVQFDAALLPEIGLKKNPGSALKEAANVLIFPSLNAGNIGLHITRHLTDCRTFGPFFQGGMENICCIHSGSSVQDIVDTVILAGRLCGEQSKFKDS